jgi:U3 small nucleolar RNA-associated protein 22
MNPLPAKRRKLDHTSTSPDDSESESRQPQSPSIISKEAPAPPRPVHIKPAHDGDDSALYSGEIYKSSLFKLQVDELLREVAPNYEKRFDGLIEALHKVKGLVESIEAHQALPVSQWISSHKIILLTLALTDFRRHKVAAQNTQNYSPFSGPKARQ